MTAEGRLPGAQARLRPCGCATHCQITGRPRETIRRKPEAALEAQGRVQRVDGGYVYDTQSVDEDIRALSADGVRRYMTTAREIQAALADADHALKARPHGRGA